MRRWLIVACLAVACGSPQAPAPPAVSPVAAAPPADAAQPDAPALLLTRDHVPSTVQAAYADWTAGRKEQALAKMKAVIAALEAPIPPQSLWVPAPKSPKREMGWSGRVLRSDDGAWLATLASEGVVLLDGKTAELRGLVDQKGYDTWFVEGTSLLAVVAPKEMSIFDVVTRQPIARVPATGTHLQAPGCLVYAEPGDPAGAFLHVWNTRTRTESRVVESKIEDLGELTWLDPGRLLVASGSQAHELFDLTTGKRLLAYRGGDDTDVPTASPDGKWFAFAVVNVQGSGFHGKTTLVDRSSGRVVATSGACPYPTSVAFSSTSRRLAVGDLRRACVLDIPSLRLVARTGEVRKHMGPEDDLQATAVSFVARDSVITVRTADGTLGLYRPNGGKIWTGRGEVLAGPSDTLQVVAEDRSRLWSISPGLVVSERALSEAEAAGLVPSAAIGKTPSPDDGKAIKALVDRQLCHIGPWLFPRAACENWPANR
jgi:hypothetical protein